MLPIANPAHSGIQEEFAVQKGKLLLKKHPAISLNEAHCRLADLHGAGIAPTLMLPIANPAHSGIQEEFAVQKGKLLLKKHQATLLDSLLYLQATKVVV
jgi:hypothetical protein